MNAVDVCVKCVNRYVYMEFGHVDADSIWALHAAFIILKDTMS